MIEIFFLYKNLAGFRTAPPSPAGRIPACLAPAVQSFESYDNHRVTIRRISGKAQYIQNQVDVVRIKNDDGPDISEMPVSGFDRCLKKLFTRGFVASVVLAFAISLILASAPSSARSLAPPVAEGLATGAICAPAPSSGDTTHNSAPHGHHTHGDCCFLHHSAVTTPPALRLALFVEFPAVRLSANLAKIIRFSPPDPGQSPQSPRAPPVSFG